MARRANHPDARAPALFDTVLAEQVRNIDQLYWDERKVGELVLSREPLTGLDESARS